MHRRWHGLSIPIASIVLSCVAHAADFNIPRGDLAAALNAYSAQSGVHLMVSVDAIRGIKTVGVKGELQPDAALLRILSGTGFSPLPQSAGGVAIVRAASEHSENARDHIDSIQLAAAQTAPASLETVTVTSSKIGGDVQNIPISITALSQEQLTATQTAGGPDLVKQVPNMTFTKTNFSGYSIQLRGIGTQAISVTTDPAVAVALNDIPFIRNHFFEQEFYDVNQVEVLRGPQGTLYGRNATAGVVNLVSAKPTDDFEAMASADFGNYQNRRFEGMINIPIVDDWLGIRVAGEWTKRDGYTTNGITGDPVDGRDLWSSRVTIGWKPVQEAQVYLVWEHFSEDDDRMRTQKQLCKTDPGRSDVLGVPVTADQDESSGVGTAFTITQAKLSQGCLPTSLYSPDAFEVPNGYSLPYVIAGDVTNGMNTSVDPYASTTQSRNLRVIETQIDPRYIAKNDTLELNADYNVTPALTFTSQTGYNNDSLWSTEDYNRFNTSPGIFQTIPPNGSQYIASLISADGVFCDPQLGCSNRLVAQDISRERAWQLGQEFRLASNFAGPFNFSAGGNYMHYETVEDYYVFANSLTLYSAYADGGSGGNGGSLNDYQYGAIPWMPGVSTNRECSHSGGGQPFGNQYNNPANGGGQPLGSCVSIDPNPLGSVNNAGHNYFLSRNPYVLNSYAAFGETYYQIAQDLKLTGGIRWTDDQKHFVDIPSELIALGYGYAPIGTVDQQWNQFTGRLAANWTPKLDFTDQTLVYGSYAHGYKAGGANPPGAVLYNFDPSAGGNGIPTHPLTFNPEFVDAYELGSKNTLLDGGLTLNGDIFFYNYKGYQISEIVDRTSINLNFNATVKGAELEATYEPLPGLKFNFAGGYEDTRIDNGQSSVDLMDRTAGHPGWVLMKPFITQPSNCIFPAYVVAALLYSYNSEGNPAVSACEFAYLGGEDPGVKLVDGLGNNATYSGIWTGANDPSHNLVNGKPYYTDTSPTAGTSTNYGYPIALTYGGPFPPQANFIYPGFDPRAGTPGDPYVGQNTYNGVDYGPVPNNGAGFSKNLDGNKLPNAPPLTISFGAQYTLPITTDWAGTLRGDYYWQDYSWARVFNDNPYDRIRGYTNVNLTLILTNQNGWQVMGYMKNVFNVTAITGTFLNSDDSGLTTNVFLTDPRLVGVRVTKNW
jgi:iron complex outermembrane receptor protein